jgi:hypothetical protein
MNIMGRNGGELEINYEMVLRDLLDKRTRVDQAIESVRDLIGEAGRRRNLGQPAVVKFPNDTFEGMPIRVAGEKYLQLVGKPQTTAEIADALHKGGLRSRSRNLVNATYTGLTRNEAIVRVGRGLWALREWEPPTASQPH